MRRLARLAFALGLALASAPAAAQTPGYALIHPCGGRVPDTFDALVATALAEDGTTLRAAPEPGSGLIALQPDTCDAPLASLRVVIVAPSGLVVARSGRLALDGLDPTLQGRVIALWIGEQLRSFRSATPSLSHPAGALSAPSVPPYPRPEPEPARELEPLMVRGSFAGSFSYDFVPAGVGGGFDARLALGARGTPTVAGEIQIGGSGMSMPGPWTWTELRGSLGGLLSFATSRETTAEVGARAYLIHEVLTQTPDGVFTPDVTVNDALELRAAGFAAVRLFLYRGLSVFLEIEVAATVWVPLAAYDAASSENVVHGIARLGLSLE